MPANNNVQSYLLEVMASNTWQGQHILLNTSEEMSSAGLRPGSVRSVACFGTPVLKGLRVTPVPFTKGAIPGQQEIIDTFKSFPALFNLRHHPVIGEIREGLYAGQKVALFTQSEIRSHFSIDAIRVAAKRGTPYLQAQWHYAKTHAEAQPYYCNPKQSLMLNVLRDHYVFKDVPLTKGEHQIFRDNIKGIYRELVRWGENVEKSSQVEQLPHLAEIYVQLIGHMQCDSHRRKLMDVLYHLRRTIKYRHQYWPLNLRVMLMALNNIINDYAR